MGASSSCCFCRGKVEESPRTENDPIAELEMVGAEGACTSRRSEYYSERCEAMMRSRGQFSDDVSLDIEFSESHWSEVSRLEVAPQSAEEEELNRENREVLEELKKKHPSLFHCRLYPFDLGRMIAKGGQAEIYEINDFPKYLLKVFERGTSLRDLRRSWPLPALNNDVRQCIVNAGILEDGRFAFVMRKYWGDLRKLIDQAMREKNADGVQGPPFPYKWKDYKRWPFYGVDFMAAIARHMRDLHEKGILHRDLKASNVLLGPDFMDSPHVLILKGMVVADFECSIGVLGTGYWRAPEVLATLGKQETLTNEQWEKADVYSYGMTCFEIVTGRIPFDGELGNTKADRQLVIDGKRPQLPSDLNHVVKHLINKCWEPNPSLRPTFRQIVYVTTTLSINQCQFRLFGVGDDLPPQYCLATVEEVNDYPIALMAAMSAWEIANLENGSIEGLSYGMNTRLEKRSDVGHKLARLHH